jgi:hypothetical protein
MDVHFARRPDNGSTAEFVRPDAVTVRLRSYDRTSVVPHDLAHLVVERALRVRTGLWGSLAAGAEFDSVEIVAGRLKHDHRARSAALRKANHRDLQLAEVLVGVVLEAAAGQCQGLQRRLAGAWSLYRRDPCPPTAAAAGAVAELLTWGPTWHALGPGDRVTLSWR